MIQGSHRLDDVIDELASRIAAAERPWRIVLFGSRARGDAREDSDYDIIVEMDVGDARPLDVQVRIQRLFRGRPWSLDVKVLPPNEIERRRDDPGAIEWDAAREGRVIYADPAAAASRAHVDRVREEPSALPESYAEWLSVAEDDLRHYRHLLDTGDDYWAAICFLCQQASEKFLKTLIVSRYARPKRTHDIAELIAAARAAGCALPSLAGDYKRLTEYAVTTRYPIKLKLSEAEARAAVAQAEGIISAVREELPRQIH
jgi:HEPN domain-containing protein/predicted nucleotidyltransferase